jgi:hypothetical protein
MSDKKIFIVTPRGGLCNQLISITNGIIYANYFNRNIHFNGFQLDYKNNDEYICCDKILNFKLLQNNINKLNLSVNILIDITYDKIYKKIDNECLLIKDLYKEIDSPDNLNIDILNIGNLLNVNLPPSNDKINYETISNTINISLDFSDYYINCANNIKTKLNLKSYACVHMRLENDAIDYFSKCYKLTNDCYNRITKNNYIRELDNIYKDKLKYNNIYVCSSLIIQENINNEFYNELKTKYSLVDKNHLINKDDINKYRELYAIIDFIIAKDADYFVGNHPSTFSHYINNYFNIKNKPSKLI